MPKKNDSWAQFKTEMGDGHFQAGLRAIDEAIQLIESEYGPQILSIVLFGSFARKDRGYDDIDLLLITDQDQGSVHEVTRELAKKVFGRLFWDYGQLFSFIVYNKAQFQRLKDFLPLFDEVRRDGVLLYGEDFFEYGEVSDPTLEYAQEDAEDTVVRTRSMMTEIEKLLGEEEG